MNALKAFLVRRPVLGYGLALGFFFAVGLLGHLLPATRGLMLGLTPFFLLASGVSALVLAWPQSHGKALAAFLVLAYALTLGLEILGVATGWVFGAYHYGASLGPGVAGVPLIIGFNWVLVVLAAASVFSGLPGQRWFAGPLAALLATGFDWVMEPVAMALDYWHWEGGVIPLQNYLAWFLIALVLATAFSWSGLRLGRRTLLVLIATELVFFAALRLGLGLA